MADKKGAGLMMVWTDVPEDKEAEFNRWYDEEHIPERLAIPGFLSAARYVAVSGGPKYLASYEVESPEVLQTDEYKRVLASPTDWSKRMSPTVIGVNFIRNVYQQIFPSATPPEVAQSDMAPALQIGRMEVPANVDAEFNQWYNTIYIPNYEKVPGCIRGRRYRALEGQPQYCTVYEFENEKVSQTPEWAAQRDINPQNAQMRTIMTHATGSPGVYKKIFPL